MHNRREPPPPQPFLRRPVLWQFENRTGHILEILVRFQIPIDYRGFASLEMKGLVQSVGRLKQIDQAQKGRDFVPEKPPPEVASLPRCLPRAWFQRRRRRDIHVKAQNALRMHWIRRRFHTGHARRNLRILKRKPQSQCVHEELVSDSAASGAHLYDERR